MSYYENALKMRPYMEKAAASLSDADALEVPTLFPAWEEGTAYAADTRVEHGGTLYRCVQAHTSQAGWMPPTASRRMSCPRASTSRSPTTTPARPTWAQRWGSSMTAAPCT